MLPFFLKVQGHQGIFSQVKGTLWGNCKLLLEHFKGIKAITKGHGGNRLCYLHELLSLKWSLSHFFSRHNTSPPTLFNDFPFIAEQNATQNALVATKNISNCYSILAFSAHKVCSVCVEIFCHAKVLGENVPCLAIITERACLSKY